MKHVQFRSRVKLNGLIKVEVYLLFEFPVGRVRGYRKFLNYQFLYSIVQKTTLTPCISWPVKVPFCRPGKTRRRSVKGILALFCYILTFGLFQFMGVSTTHPILSMFFDTHYDLAKLHFDRSNIYIRNFKIIYARNFSLCFVQLLYIQTCMQLKGSTNRL